MPKSAKNGSRSAPEMVPRLFFRDDDFVSDVNQTS
jgi:hypothetical protein